MPAFLKNKSFAKVCLGFLVLVLLAVLALYLSRSEKPAVVVVVPTPLASASPKVQFPEDGVLEVKGSTTIRVPQLIGTCENGQCSFPKISDPMTIQAPPGKLTLKSEKSTVLSITATSKDGPAPFISLVGSEIVFEAAPAGDYTITVLGDLEGRGIWSFSLKVV